MIVQLIPISLSLFLLISLKKAMEERKEASKGENTMYF